MGKLYENQKEQFEIHNKEIGLGEFGTHKKAGETEKKQVNAYILS